MIGILDKENDMSDLALYLGVAVVGYLAGSRLRQAEGIIRWTSRIQTAAIVVLIFTMGTRMGANRQVMMNLNSIGLYALVMTAFIMTFSAAAITLARNVMGMDRQGNLKSPSKGVRRDAAKDAEVSACGTCTAGAEEEAEEEEKKGDPMTVIILVCVAAGLAFGYFAVGKLFADADAFDALAGQIITVGLCTLLFFVGFDMGVDGTVIGHFRAVGLRVLVFPFIIMAGTLAGALICGLFLPISIREALAVGAGFGWYTFAPGIIMEKGLVMASAISFMHNILREYISVLIIPLVAHRAGYLEAMAVAGCSSMDVCLPIIERSTRGDIAMYAFISGVIQSMAVPVLVPLILG